MASLESVDRLRTRTGVTYDEAREALDSSDGDMLDALIWLENNGKIEPPRVASYSTDKQYDAGDWRSEQPENRDRFYDRNSGRDGRNTQTSRSRSAKNDAKHSYYYDESDSRARASSYAKSAAGFIGRAFQIGNSTMFEISRYGRDVTKIPLTVVIIVFFLFFQVPLILLPIGLFFGFRYKLTGNLFDEGPVNSIMNTAARVVEGIKDAFNNNKHG